MSTASEGLRAEGGGYWIAKIGRGPSGHRGSVELWQIRIPVAAMTFGTDGLVIAVTPPVFTLEHPQNFRQIGSHRSAMKLRVCKLAATAAQAAKTTGGR